MLQGIHGLSYGASTNYLANKSLKPLLEKFIYSKVEVSYIEIRNIFLCNFNPIDLVCAEVNHVIVFKATSL